jgi:hypothetical protein
MSFKIGYKFSTKNLNKNSEIIDNPIDFVSDFVIVDILGSGSYGNVYNVKHLQSNLKLVI